MGVAYRLGVDVGTTFTAAAVANGGPPTMLGLGNRAMQVPSVLFVEDDGEILIGESADRRGVVEPTRVAREFKRRIGDPVPLLVAGAPYSPQALTAHVLRWVVAAASRQLGSPPERVTVTHPANWGPFKKELLQQVVQLADLTNATTCPEPQAAAIQYAARRHVPVGTRIAVYDLGGGTFDACVLEKTSGGFELLGTPVGIEHLGGIDFDEAVYQRVLAELDVSLLDLAPGDAGLVVALHRLRRDCVEAKEALSSDVECIVPVSLPGISRSVRLSRQEFESLVRPALEDTVAALDRAMRSAGVASEDLDAIVLVGGSSRMPLVSDLLKQSFATPTALDTHPKHDVALGAVQADLSSETRREYRAGPPAEQNHTGSPTAPPPMRVADRAENGDRKGIAAGGGQKGSWKSTGRRHLRRPWVAAAGCALALVLAVGAGWWVTRPGETVTERTLTVEGATDWTATSIVVEEGDVLRLTATGSISDDRSRPEQEFGPDGQERDAVQDVHDEDPELGFRHAALLGRWGPDGTVFSVGRGRFVDTVVSPRQVGRLYLGVNDSRFDDNSGTFEVRAELTTPR